MSLAPGTVVGGEFEVLGPLSEGGMGAVFVALQKSVGRRRALKVMHRELLADVKLRDRFVQEAKIGATIDSEHVVEVIAAGIDEKLKMPWLAMELLEGKDLAALVGEGGHLPVADVREVMDQLCHALAAAHEQGVVHRDLKPENVFVARTRRRGSPFVVKVLDFGIAKVIAEARATSAATAALGTPTFMAPEQTEARSKVTPAADVWALGLIVFRTLTGKHYWNAANEEGASITALMRELVIDPLVPASQRAKALGVTDRIPEGFDAWFATCVARDPKARFADAGAAQRELLSVRGFDEQGTVTLHTRLGQERASSADAPTRPSATVAAAPLDREEAELAAADGQATIAGEPLRDPDPEPDATIAAGPLDRDAGVTVVGAPISERMKTVVAEPHASKTIAARPLPPQPPKTAPSKSTVGLLIGGLVVAGAGVAAVSLTGGEDAEEPSPSASVTPSPSTQRDRDAAGNRWVVITPPATPVMLGVPDTAAATKRGLRAARKVMSRAEPYAIQSHEVSWAELDPFLKATPKLAFERPASVPAEAAERADLPAVGVPWEVANAYCQSIGANLPDEAQWEFAARGSELRSLPWGTGADLTQVRAFLGRTGTVTRVASTPRDVTAEGVHDLMGNAREWTSTTWYPDVAAGDESWVIDGETAARVVRGWPLRAEPPADARELDAAYRDWVCATGACSPLHPNLSTKPPLASVGVSIESSTSTAPSPLRTWISSAEFSELFGRCAVASPLAADARVTLQADGKGCAHANLAPRPSGGSSASRDFVFASLGVEPVDVASPYVFAQQKVPSSDRDGDGISDMMDKCPDQPEDKDGFEDSDGCPDPDNDRDGIPDIEDRCPNTAETNNGFEDEDGCPDQKVAELMPKPTPTATPQPTSIATPTPTSTATCKPSRATLSSKDLAPRFLQCLDAGAPSSLSAAAPWKDEVVFKLKTVKIPPALAEMGFRCVRKL